jgi:hypothetical protein
VVGKLAERHGIRVQLRESPYGGTTAIVLIPNALVIEGPETAALSGRNGRAAITAGSTEPSEVDTSARPPVAAVPAAPESAATAAPAGPAALAPAPVEDSRPPAHRRPVSLAPAPAPDDSGPLPTRIRGGGPGHGAEHPGAEPDEGTVLTPAGLPWRVRQTNLTRALRRDPDLAADSGDEPEASRARTPEEVRQMMASYQTGTRRGRSAAEDIGAAPPEPSRPDEPTPA